MILSRINATSWLIGVSGTLECIAYIYLSDRKFSRPLPREMLDYARSDTHYLLYIYDNLRNALLDRSGSRSNTPPATSSSGPSATLLREVLTRSEETSLRVYEKEVYDEESGSGPGGWDILARKWNKSYLTPSDVRGVQRLVVYKTVHSWRDRVARLEDESTRYLILLTAYNYLLTC